MASAGWVATISLGRPVLPPLVVALNSGPRTGSGARPPLGVAATARSSSADSVGRPPASSGPTPMASEGSARSRIARRSMAGSRSEIGWGVAPTHQAASIASTNSVELGSPMVTIDPGVTPRAANRAASRPTRSTTSARENVTSPQLSDGRRGSSAASSRSRAPNAVSARSPMERSG